jgi:ABC-2 type transport system permease protein
MSPLFGRLLRLELREALRQPLTGLILLALFVAMLVAVATGTTRVEQERATIEQVALERAKALEQSKAAAQRYAAPSGLKIEYHRDPTDAFGYMNYFLVAHAVKPPLSLGALAAGQADLYPSQIRIDFTSIFPDAAYDLGNPHELKLGRFDLAFVIIYLLPLGLIALAATRLSGEHDSGILRLIAAQPVRPATVAAAKYSALAIVAVIAVLGGAAIALALNGQFSATPQLLLVGLMTGMWILLWIVLAAAVATLWRGAIASIVTLTLLWGAFTLLLPAAAALLIEVAQPSPSRIAYIDSSRQVMDSFYGDEAQVHAAWLARFPEFVPLASDMLKSPEVKRFARDDYYRQSLLPQRQSFDAHTRAVLGASDALRLLSPAMMLDDALQSVAGSDLRRHADFIAAADAYSERLRRYFEPLALANVAHPSRACPDCPGRMNFTRYDEVPIFEAEVDESVGLRRAAVACLYLTVMVLVASLLAQRRLRQWPV